MKTAMPRPTKYDTVGRPRRTGYRKKGAMLTSTDTKNLNSKKIKERLDKFFRSKDVQLTYAPWRPSWL
jgi:hypothetical protein